MASIMELKGMASSKLGFARSNNFMIELPSLQNSSAKPPFGLGGVAGSLAQGVADQVSSFIPSIPGLTPDAMPNSRELNTLCRGTSLPGKQVLTVDRKVGMKNEKVVYGYGVTDVSMTFLMLNDYGVKNYFDEWYKLMLDDGMSADGQKTAQVVKYKSEYAKSIKIHQLRKAQLGFSGSLGPISANVGLGGGSVYSVELHEAFPITFNEITFSNDMDGLVELTVSFAFTNWKRIKPSQNFINVGIGF